MLLSVAVCKDLGILPPCYPEPYETQHIRQIQHEASREPTQQGARVVDDTKIPKLKAKLLQEFADVFNTEGPLKTMVGEPMKIELYADAIPFSVPGHRPIPFAQREQVREMLEDMVSKNIIASVTEPTDWTHPLVVAAKPNGKLYKCFDLTKLNQFVQRPLHPFVLTRDAIASITCHARYFNKFAAVHVYWQIPLDEKTQ